MDEEGYCKGFAYSKPMQGLGMKSIIECDRIKYYINVNRYIYVLHVPIMYLDIEYLVYKRLLKQIFQISHAINIKRFSEFYSQDPHGP